MVINYVSEKYIKNMDKMMLKQILPDDNIIAGDVIVYIDRFNHRNCKLYVVDCIKELSIDDNVYRVMVLKQGSINKWLD